MTMRLPLSSGELVRVVAGIVAPAPEFRHGQGDRGCEPAPHPWKVSRRPQAGSSTWAPMLISGSREAVWSWKIADIDDLEAPRAHRASWWIALTIELDSSRTSAELGRKSRARIAERPTFRLPTRQ